MLPVIFASRGRDTTSDLRLRATLFWRFRWTVLELLRRQVPELKVCKKHLIFQRGARSANFVIKRSKNSASYMKTTRACSVQ